MLMGFLFPFQRSETPLKIHTSPLYGRYLLVRGFQDRLTPIFEIWTDCLAWTAAGRPRLEGER